MSLIRINSGTNKGNNTQNSLPVNFTIKRTNPKIWLADLSYTQQQISHESMPAAIGGITTFTETNLGLTSQIKLFKYPEKLATALENDAPEIIGFSNYLWNFQLSLSFAKRIREVYPKTIIVFGGPNYPVELEQQEKFLRDNPAIDFYVIHEGEIAFANLIAALINADMDKNNIKNELPSVHYIDNAGAVHLTEHVERIKDLTQIPSPYTCGRMDEFFDGKLIPVIQTTRGCPFSCTFCVEGLQYYNKVYRNNHEKISAELDYIGRRMEEIHKGGGRNDLALVDSNFGMYDHDITTCQLIAQCQEKYGWPEYIQVDTGKNNKAKVLNAAKLVKGAMRLSGSVQSLTPEVLDNIKRSNISADDLLKLAMESADISDARSEIILGLPGETLKSHLETVRTIINAGFNHVLIYQLMMLPGTDLYVPEVMQKFGMKLRYRILPRCFGYYDVLGKTIIAADMEEICVSTNSLSFDEYVECRKLNLIINLFYNDGFFGTALKFLKTLNISIYRWLEIIKDEKLEGRIEELFESYEKATREELWLDKDALIKFVQNSSTIDKYIQGEIGYNLIYTFKAIGLCRYANELMDLAKKTILKLLIETKNDTEENISFIDDALKFDSCRHINLFYNINEDPTILIHYDIENFNTTKENTPIQQYKLEEAISVKFALHEDQHDIIKRSLDIYGQNDMGVSRIITRVFVKKLLRHPIYSRELSVRQHAAMLTRNELYQQR